MLKGYVDQIDEGIVVIVCDNSKKVLLPLSLCQTLAVNDIVEIEENQIVSVKKADHNLYLQIKKLEKEVIEPFSQKKRGK